MSDNATLELRTPMAKHLAEHARHEIMPGLVGIIASEIELSAIETQAAVALRSAASNVADHHNGEPGHDMNDACWRTLYAALAEPTP